MEPEFQMDDLVLGHVRGFPQWPARVTHVIINEGKKPAYLYRVIFFGTDEEAILRATDLVKYDRSPEVLEKVRPKRFKHFNTAIYQLERALREKLDQQSVNFPSKESTSSKQLQQETVKSEPQSRDALSQIESVRKESLRTPKKIRESETRIILNAEVELKKALRTDVKNETRALKTLEELECKCPEWFRPDLISTLPSFVFTLEKVSRMELTTISKKASTMLNRVGTFYAVPGIEVSMEKAHENRGEWLENYLLEYKDRRREGEGLLYDEVVEKFHLPSNTFAPFISPESLRKRKIVAE